MLADIQTGLVPSSVNTFSELHEYVDANCYGGTEALIDELDAAVPDTDEGHSAAMIALIHVMNQAMEIVNQWLQSGGVANGLGARQR